MSYSSCWSSVSNGKYRYCDARKDSGFKVGPGDFEVVPGDFEVVPRDFEVQVIFAHFL